MRRRAALVLAVLAVAGCGGDEPPDDKRAGPQPRPVDTTKLDQADRALEQLEDSDLPEDARKELEAAKELLDEARDGADR